MHVRMSSGSIPGASGPRHGRHHPRSLLPRHSSDRPRGSRHRWQPHPRAETGRTVRLQRNWEDGGARMLTSSVPQASRLPRRSVVISSARRCRFACRNAQSREGPGRCDTGEVTASGASGVWSFGSIPSLPCGVKPCAPVLLRSAGSCRSLRSADPTRCWSPVASTPIGASFSCPMAGRRSTPLSTRWRGPTSSWGTPVCSRTWSATSNSCWQRAASTFGRVQRSNVWYSTWRAEPSIIDSISSTGSARSPMS